MVEESELLRSAAGLFWAWIPPAALQGGVVLLIAGLLDRLLSPRSLPELRESIWALALVKLVLPPTLASPFALVPLVAPALAATAPAPLGSDPARWALAAAGLWAAGALALGTFFALRARRAERSISSERQAASAEDLASLARAAALLGQRQRPRLFRLPESGGPFVLGALRPTIYLPRAVGAAELEHVLLHELAHVARRDGLRQGLARLLQVLFWFHPLLPWARRRLAAAAEAACDRKVARALGQEASGYRATLLAFYQRAVASSPGMPFLAPPTALRLRLAAIAEAGRRPTLAVRLAGALLVAVLAAALLPMAATAERRALAVAEWITRPPGCLQLRYLVLERLAAEAKAQPAAHNP